MFCAQCPSGCWWFVNKTEPAAHHHAHPQPAIHRPSPPYPWSTPGGTHPDPYPFNESPGDRQTGDESAWRFLGFMRAQDGQADRRKIPLLCLGVILWCMRLHPYLPSRSIIVLCLIKTIPKTADGITRSIFGILSKPSASVNSPTE